MQMVTDIFKRDEMIEMKPFFTVCLDLYFEVKFANKVRNFI